MNDKNAPETANSFLSNIYSQGVITDCKVRNSFSKLCSGDTSLRDEPRLGLSSDFNQDILRENLECILCKSSLEFVLNVTARHPDPQSAAN